MFKRQLLDQVSSCGEAAAARIAEFDEERRSRLGGADSKDFVSPSLEEEREEWASLSKSASQTRRRSSGGSSDHARRSSITGDRGGVGGSQPRQMKRVSKRPRSYKSYVSTSGAAGAGPSDDEDDPSTKGGGSARASPRNHPAPSARRESDGPGPAASAGPGPSQLDGTGPGRSVGTPGAAPANSADHQHRSAAAAAAALAALDGIGDDPRKGAGRGGSAGGGARSTDPRVAAARILAGGSPLPSATSPSAFLGAGPVGAVPTLSRRAASASASHDSAAVAGVTLAGELGMDWTRKEAKEASARAAEAVVVAAYDRIAGRLRHPAQQRVLRAHQRRAAREQRARTGRGERTGKGACSTGVVVAPGAPSVGTHAGDVAGSTGAIDMAERSPMGPPGETLDGLRQRRSNIIARLKELHASRLASTSSARPALSQRYPSDITAFRMGMTPLRLPLRRRTHWDYVMDEMRWAATDFLEERRWKERAAAAVCATAEAGHADRRRRKGTGKKGKLQPSVGDLGAAAAAARAIGEAVTALQGVGMDLTSHNPVAVTKTEVVSRSLEISPVPLGESLTMNPGAEPSESQQADVPTPDPVLSLENIEMKDVDMDAEEINIEALSRDVEESLAALRRIDRVVPGNDEDGRRVDGTDLLDCQVGPSAWLKEICRRDVVDSAGGAILCGPGRTGKTVVACCHVWHSRGDGPQLVVCPSHNLLRWKYELSKFSDLNVLTLGRPGDSTSKSNSNFNSKWTAGDVVICEHSCVFDVGGTGLGTPCGFLSENQWSGLVVDARDEGRQHSESSWWDPLLALPCLADVSTCCRLLVDRPVSVIVPDVLARRAALCLPRAFRSSPVRALTWATSRADDTAAGKPYTLGPCAWLGDDNLPPSAALFSASTVRPCRMGEKQRATYLQCCGWVRGALSARGPSASPGVASLAMLRLRRVCAHRDLPLVGGVVAALGDVSGDASIGEVYGGRTDRGAGTHNFGGALYGVPSLLGSTAVSGMASPDAAFALASDSAKLTELLRVLLEEGARSGVVFDDEGGGDGKFRFISRDASGGDHADGGRSKILILAALPEVLQLVHFFLLSCGIPHGHVGRVALRSDDDDHGGASRAWAADQETLRRFRCGARAGDCILVAPPDAVAGPRGGVGSGHADLVVVVDEDWSGRRAGFLEDILGRCAMGCGGPAPPVTRLVRLVCMETVEDSLAGQGPDGIGGADAAGCNAAAGRITRWRGRKLSEVLRTLVPPDGAPDPPFLPFPISPHRTMSGADCLEPSSPRRADEDAAVGAALAAAESRACVDSDDAPPSLPPGIMGGPGLPHPVLAALRGSSQPKRSSSYSGGGGAAYAAWREGGLGRSAGGRVLSHLSYGAGGVGPKGSSVRCFGPLTAELRRGGASVDPVLFAPPAVPGFITPGSGGGFGGHLVVGSASNGPDRKHTSALFYPQPSRLHPLPLVPKTDTRNQGILNATISSPNIVGMHPLASTIIGPGHVVNIAAATTATREQPAMSIAKDFWAGGGAVSASEPLKDVSTAATDPSTTALPAPIPVKDLCSMDILNYCDFPSVADSAKVALNTSTVTACYRHYVDDDTLNDYVMDLDEAGEDACRPGCMWLPDDGGGTGTAPMIKPRLGSMLLYVTRPEAPPSRRSSKKRKGGSGAADADLIARTGPLAVFDGEATRQRAATRLSAIQSRASAAAAAERAAAARSTCGPGVPATYGVPTRGVGMPPAGAAAAVAAAIGSGDAVGISAAVRRHALRKVSVRRGMGVDFGPFGRGLVNNLDNKIAASPSKAQAGISLPMGVSLRHREVNFDAEPWSQEEDEVLIEVAKRYGFNWHVTSQYTAFTQNTSYTSKRSRRSARQCRERWQHLVRIRPSLVNEANDIISNRHKSISTRMSSLATSSSTSKKRLLSSLSDINKGNALSHSMGALNQKNSDEELSSKLPYKQDMAKVAVGGNGCASAPSDSEHRNSLFPTVTDASRNSTISRLNQLKKFSKVPNSMQGVPSSAEVRSLVPPHESHAIATHAASTAITQEVSDVTSTELWPLQLLDVLGKFSARQRTPVVGSGGGGISSAKAVGGQQRHVQTYQLQQQQQQGTAKAMPMSAPVSHQQQLRGHAAAVRGMSLQKSPEEIAAAAQQQERIKQAARAAALAPTKSTSRNKSSANHSGPVPSAISNAALKNMKPVSSSAIEMGSTLQHPMMVHPPPSDPSMAGSSRNPMLSKKMDHKS